MRTLLKILLLALFAIVVFMPMRGIAVWLYWSLFLAMFFVLVLYYYISYWVSVRSLPPAEYRFTAFAGKVPPMTSEDLVRGRLVVVPGRIQLFQRGTGKDGSRRPKEVWSVRIDQVEGFSIGRVIGLRNGLILNLTEGQEARFAIFGMKRRKEDLTRALGWTET